MIVDDYLHCERLTREGDRDRYLCALFAPAERRPALWALCAFNIEIARIPSVAPEPFAAAVRLQWWSEALRGERDGEAAAHPVAAALRHALAEARVDAAPLLEHLDAQRAQAFGEPETFSDAAFFFTAARLLGAPAAGLGAAAARAGEAYALAIKARTPDIAREHYRAFRQHLGELPKIALPAFLAAALVPLILQKPQATQWRRQLALLRAAWFGFPAI
jgi:phytoene/squalene synthetase